MNAIVINGNYARLIVNGEVVARIGLGMGSYTIEGHPVGYGVIGDNHNKGYMTKLLKAFILHTEEPILQAVILKENLASQSVATKCGFSLVGENEGCFFYQLKIQKHNQRVA